MGTYVAYRDSIPLKKVDHIAYLVRLLAGQSYFSSQCVVTAKLMTLGNLEAAAITAQNTQTETLLMCDRVGDSVSYGTIRYLDL